MWAPLTVREHASTQGIFQRESPRGGNIVSVIENIGPDVPATSTFISFSTKIPFDLGVAHAYNTNIQEAEARGL